MEKYTKRCGTEQRSVQNSPSETNSRYDFFLESCADCLKILEATTSWSPKGLSKPVMGQLFVFDTIYSFLGRSETVASNRRFVHPPGHRWTNMQDWWNDNWQRENRITRRWTGPCPPNIAHRLPWELNRASALRRRWLTAWAKARPSTIRCSSETIFTF